MQKRKDRKAEAVPVDREALQCWLGRGADGLVCAWTDAEGAEAPLPCESEILEQAIDASTMTHHPALSLSLEALQQQINQAASGRFGSGWTWLIRKAGCNPDNLLDSLFP
jgi:hypothetical protein